MYSDEDELGCFAITLIVGLFIITLALIEYKKCLLLFNLWITIIFTIAVIFIVATWDIIMEGIGEMMDNKYNSKEQKVEEQQNGCEFCKTFDFSRAEISDMDGKPRIYLVGIGEADEDKQFKFCPVCGRELR